MADEYDEPGESDIRRRAAYLLGMLAVVAVLVVVVMVTFFDSSSPSNNDNQVASIGGPSGTSAAPSSRAGSSSGAPSSGRPATRAASSPRTSPSLTTPSSGSARPASCPTKTACVVDGDIGNVVTAINAYRRSHGVAPVSGAVATSSQTCAVTNGDNCPSAFFWEPVEGRDGAQVVQKIAGGGGKGSSFLLDPKVTSFDVGWAFIPSTKSYACAVVAR